MVFFIKVPLPLKGAKRTDEQCAGFNVTASGLYVVRFYLARAFYYHNAAKLWKSKDYFGGLPALEDGGEVLVGVVFHMLLGFWFGLKNWTDWAD